MYQNDQQNNSITAFSPTDGEEMGINRPKMENDKRNFSNQPPKKDPKKTKKTFKQRLLSWSL